MQNFKKGRPLFSACSFIKKALLVSSAVLVYVLIPLISKSQDKPLINSVLNGQVVDGKTNVTVPGATVQIKGTTHSVQTNANGAFSFKTGQPFPYTLIVSYTGYKTKELIVDGSPVTVVLEEDLNELNEVQVVGYTQTKKGAKTSAITTIAAEDIGKAAYTSVTEKLQGQVPGLLVSSNSGVPGTSVLVRLRGAISITGGNDPLYVVDGVFINNDNLQGLSRGLGGQTPNPLSDLNPDDIETVSVLKDANATAVYGARGQEPGVAYRSSWNLPPLYRTDQK